MAVVTAIASLAGIIMQAKSANDAKKDAEKKAAAIREEGAEKKRKLAEEAAYRKSLAKARAGASGVLSTGSIASYLDAMDEATAKDLAWMDTAIGNSSESAISSGSLASLNSLAGAFSSLSSGAATYSSMA